MVAARPSSAGRWALYCPSCKEEFLAYKDPLAPRCPRCGRKIRSPLQRLVLRIVAMLIVLVLLAVMAGIYFWKR